MNEFIFSFRVDDATLNTYMNEMEDDQLLAEAAMDSERQLTFQEQMGGSVTSREPGRFEFNLNPYVDSINESMGVRERHYTANLRQRGQFIPCHNLNAELRDAVYRTLQNLTLRDLIPGISSILT